MEFVITVAFMGILFGLFYLVDKGYTKVFRGQPQHKTGLSVRHHKRYALFGLGLTVLGILGIMSVSSGGLAMIVMGILVLLLGAALLVYYMTFGIFYDADSFILTTFGKKSVTYLFSDIKEQRLYQLQGGAVIIELHMSDGKAVSIQSVMEGAYPFLDHAFSAWCRQKGLDPDHCAFHDPAQSLWFPMEEDT